MRATRLLLVDDEEGLRTALALALGDAGYTVRTAATLPEALEALERFEPEVVVCDVRLPGGSGLELLPRVRATLPDAVVIVISAYGDTRDAIAAVRQGAEDYLEKPFDPVALEIAIEKARERQRLRRENARLRRELEARVGAASLVGRSPAMRRVLELVDRAARYRTTVLVTGESGVGKEVVARAIHELGDRPDAPFVAVNCAALPESLIESELFGHARGAFTGADAPRPGLFREADGGTLLLDEIGELPPRMQAKLLRVLQEGEVRGVGEAKSVPVDVRVIAATARNLEAEVAAGRFREDLYFRLNVVRIHVPPLRERPEDIPYLADHLLRRLAARLGRRVEGFAPGVLDALARHPWPGNVRELENAIERAIILAPGETLGLELFPFVRPDAAPPGEGPGVAPGPEEDLSVKRRLRALEAELIRKALARTGGNRTRAARLLEMSPRALHYKLREYGIEPAQPASPGGR